jgi:hypothetical protein
MCGLSTFCWILSEPAGLDQAVAIGEPAMMMHPAIEVDKLTR